MIQTISVALAAVIYLQVLYLFSCGQSFMRKSAKRESMNFRAFKVIYILIASLVFGNALLTNCHSLGTILIYLSVAALFLSRVLQVYKIQKKKFKNV